LASDHPNNGWPVLFGISTTKEHARENTDPHRRHDIGFRHFLSPSLSDDAKPADAATSEMKLDKARWTKTGR